MDTDLVIPATLDGLQHAVASISSLAREHRASPRDIFRLELVVEEIVGNVIRHSGCQGDGSIALTFELIGEEMQIVVEDEGIPFNPLDAPAPVRPTTALDVPIGGRGIMMVRRVASALHYARVDNRNRLTIRVQLHRDGEPPQA